MRPPTHSDRILGHGMRPVFRARPGHQRGVGLIEVLIAVLVMAIGLLGIAALQATALRNSQSSLERSQAVVHSYALLDAMRANLTQTRKRVYDMAMTCEVPAVPSSGATLAQTDKAAWIQALKGDQDLGATACGQVQCAAVTDDDAVDCTITVQWNDSRGSDGEEKQKLETVARI